MQALTRFVVALALVAVSGLARADTGAGKLVAPTELAALTGSGEVRVLDIRETGYEAGHIPGAVAAPYPRWRGPAGNPGKLPETAELEALVRGLGVDEGTRVVVAHEGASATDFGAAARVYWTLRTLGVRDLAILNGGVAGWREAGLPLSSEPVAVEPSAFAAELDPSWLATRAEVERQVQAGDGGRLLDARPSGFFLGKLWHDAAAKPGTIPGAESFTYEEWFEGGGPVIVGPQEARRIAAANGLDRGAPVTVSFCNTGHWAAINWFALSELAGVEGVKLYPESAVDWSQAGLPMDNVPGRVEWLWLSTRKWFERTFG
jgi:thiosulfate/3-mercaptopyruvate sulfurtransferase